MVLNNGRPYTTHKVQKEVNIVNAQNVSTGCFLGSNMVNVGSSDFQSTFGPWPATSTGTAFLDCSKVMRVRGMLEVQDAGAGNGIAEAL